MTSSNDEVVKNSEVVWIATKPHAIPRVLQEISSVAKPNQLFISVAAGTTIKTLEEVSNLLQNLLLTIVLCLIVCIESNCYSRCLHCGSMLMKIPNVSLGIWRQSCIKVYIS